MASDESALRVLPAIQQFRRPGSVTPNLTDYDAERATFSWSREAQRLDGLPGAASTSPMRPWFATPGATGPSTWR